METCLAVLHFLHVKGQRETDIVKLTEHSLLLFIPKTPKDFDAKNNLS